MHGKLLIFSSRIHNQHYISYYFSFCPHILNICWHLYHQLFAVLTSMLLQKRPGCVAYWMWCSLSIEAPSVAITGGVASQIAKFMGPTWGPSGTDRTQVGPMCWPHEHSYLGLYCWVIYCSRYLVLWHRVLSINFTFSGFIYSLSPWTCIYDIKCVISKCLVMITFRSFPVLLQLGEWHGTIPIKNPDWLRLWLGAIRQQAITWTSFCWLMSMMPYSVINELMKNIQTWIHRDYFSMAQQCYEASVGSGHETAAVLLLGFAINW